MSIPQPSGGDPTDFRLAVEAAPASGDVGFLERGLFGFEEARLGSPGHAQFAVLVRDPAGAVQGGADAHVMWRRVFVKTVYLPDALRGRGLGSRIMAVLEAEARRRGCLSLWLTALGDRASGFYRRLGFEPVGAIRDYVAGNDLYTMNKELSGPGS